MKIMKKIVSLFCVLTMMVSIFDVSFIHASTEVTTQALVYQNGNTSMPYRLYVPEDYDENQEYPVLVFLHGAGERGNDNEAQLVNAFQNLFDTHEQIWDSIVIAPQCPSGKRWVETDWTLGNYDSSAIAEEQLGTVMNILADVQSQYNTDEDRTYAMGLSMGGYGTWNLLMNHSDVFAAGIPICGAADLAKVDILKDIPIWTFHGTADPTVPYAGTEAMVNAITKAGGQKITFTTYEGSGHNIWNTAAETEGLIDWLFSQKLSDRELVNLFDRNHYDNWYQALTYNGEKLVNTNNYSNMFATHAIAVQKGDIVEWGDFGKENYVAELYTADYQFIKQINFEDTVSVDQGYTIPGVKLTAVEAYRLKYEVVDDNAGYIRFLGNISNIDRFQVFKNIDEYPDTYIPFEGNPLMGQSVLFVGDSITNAIKDDLKLNGWAGRIGTQNKMTWKNAGVSGASVSTVRSSNRVITQLKNNVNNDYDYVIMHGGVNDAMDSAEIGTMSESFDVAEFDNTTFAGGLEEMFYYATMNYAGKKLGYIVNYQTPNSTWGGATTDMSAYFAVAKQICDKWEIPYIDLYDGTITLDGVEKTYSFDILDMTNTGSLYNKDAGEVHIGGYGYDLISPFIGYWMRSLPVNTVGVLEDIDADNMEKCTYSDGDVSMPYRLYVPQNYTKNKAYPTIVLLHGAGERGNDNEAQLIHVIQDLFDVHSATRESIIIMPQCPSGKRWVETDWSKGNYDSSVIVEEQLGTVMKILDSIKAEYNVDADRTYAMGLSMGGFGTWNLLMNHSDVFAAGIPICGGADPNKADILKDIPIWTFHGTADGTVPYAGTKEMYDTIVKAGGQKITFTTYDGAGHNVWKDAAQTEGLIDWLFAQKLSDRELENLFDANHYDNWYKSLTYKGQHYVNTTNYENMFATHAIPVQKGDILEWGDYGKETYVAELYTADHKYIKQIKFTDTISEDQGYTIPGVNLTAVEAYKLKYEVVDANAGYIRFLGNYSNIQNFQIFKNLEANGYEYPDAYIPYEGNPLHGQSVLFVGDSITNAIKDDYKLNGWAGRIGTQNKMTWTNAGVSGASASTVRPNNRVIAQLQKYASNNYDYVIMHGGVNDAMDSAPIGSVAKDFSLDSFDTSTFAGALEEMFHYAVKNYAGAKLGYIVNYATPNSTWGGATKDMSAYFDVAKQICEKWGIPYIDLYSGTVILNDQEKSYSNDVLQMSKTTSLYNEDAGEVHIGGYGYDVISPFIGYWMRSLEANTMGASKAKVNVALNKPVTMSGIEGGYLSDGTLKYPQFDPVHATDGIIDTTALNNNRTSLDRNIGEYVEIDLQQEYTLSDVTVYYYPMCGAFKVQTSVDGTIWNDVASHTFNPLNLDAGNVNVKLESEPSARYVRIVQTALYPSKNYSLGINEIEVYEKQVNTDALQEAITNAEKVDVTLLEEASANTLAEALRNAYVVVEFASNQEEVDTTTSTLNDVVANLTYKPADYANVEAAKAQAQALDPLEYQNFDVVNNAINAIVYGKDIREQEVVDGYATHILEAIASLVKRQVQGVVSEPLNYKSAKLTWDAIDNVETYIIERLNTTTNEWIEVAQTSEASYVASGLKTGKTYTYRIKATGKDENENVVNYEASEELQITTALTGEVQLTLAKNEQNQFELSWTEVEGATRYIVYRKVNDGEWKKVLTLGKDVRTYTTKVMSEGTYAYQVKAARYDGVERIMTNGSNVEEGIIGSETLTLDITINESNVMLSWNKLDGMKYYDVYRSTAVDGVYRHLKRTTANQITTAKANKTYYYKVKGCSIMDGVSTYTPFSNVVSNITQ